MYFDPRIKGACPLPHDPFNALVAPRPIGWISTQDALGIVNLAPYSYFNAVSHSPHFVMFSSMNRKDSQRNAEDTGQFVANFATRDLGDIMNLSSVQVGSEISEPVMLGIEMVPSVSVLPPRVKASPAALECAYLKTVDLADLNGMPSRFSIIIGEVIGIFIDESILTDGLVDMKKSQPIARLGYLDFGVLGDIFSMERPDLPPRPRND